MIRITGTGIAMFAKKQPRGGERLYKEPTSNIKCFVAGVVMGFAASFAAASASSTAEHNGRFWNDLNRAAKDGYVIGYADAMSVSVSKIETLSAAGDVFHWKVSSKIIGEVETQLSSAEMEPTEAVAHLDTLYKNQQYMELDLGAALQLIAMRPAANSAGAASDK